MKLTFRTKLLLFSIFVAVIPLGIAGVSIVTIIKNELKSSVNEELLHAGDQITREITGKYTNWETPLLLIGNAIDNPDLPVPAKVSLMRNGLIDAHDIVALQLSAENLPPVLLARDDLRTATQATGFDLSSLWPEGKFPGLYSRSFLPIIGEVFYVAEINQWLMPISLPLKNSLNDAPAGLTALISLTEMVHRIKEEAYLYAGTVIITDNAGRELFNKERPDLANLKIVADAKTRLAAAAAHSPSVTLYQRPSGETMLAVSAFPDPLPWLVFVERSEADAYLTVSKVLFNLLLWLAVGFTGAVVGAIVFARQISRPIKALARRAQAIGQGNFNQKFNVRSNDEIGEFAIVFNQMAIQLKLYDELNIDRIISEKNKLEKLIKNMADGVLITDESHHVIMINSLIERWFQVENSRIAGQTLTVGVPNADLLALHTDALQSTEMVRGEITLRVAGEVRPIVLGAHLAKVSSERRGLVGVVAILRNITREKEIDRMKTELVSVVAHELRTPLTSIRGFTELMKMGIVPEEEEHKEYLDIVYRQSVHLGELIDKFLDISRIESGKTEIHKIPFKILDVVREVIAVNETFASQKNIAIDLQLPERVTVTVGDPELIGQVVLNLFSNAVKYSPPETTVTVSIEEEAREIFVAVTDKGYGISEENLANLFKKFYRVENNEDVKEIGGTGLGLALVKEIVEQHGGKVYVTSELKKGSTFRFSIPKVNVDALADDQAATNEGH